MTLNTIPILLWWLAILWTYTELFPRPFDDWKNTFLYVGGGLLVIAMSLATTQSRVRNDNNRRHHLRLDRPTGCRSKHPSEVGGHHPRSSRYNLNVLIF